MFQQRAKHPAALFAAAALVLLPAGYLAARSKDPQKPQMDDSKKAVHVLNRLAFGPRPGEVEKVAALGVEKWIEQQLNPEKINDSVLEARLANFRTLKMDNREIVANYPPPAVLQAIAQGRIPMPSDPKTRAIYESQMAIYKARVQNRNRNENEGEMRPQEMEGEAAENRRRADRQALQPQIRALSQKSPNERAQAILKMDPEERGRLLEAMSPEQRQRLVADMTPEQRESLLAMANPQGVVTMELMHAKMLRAIYSERQLEEVMTDFWFNHFNVFINKGADRYLTTSYERDAIRKHALGRFEDLLVATAKDPAMLFYLDNFQSIGPNSPAGKFSGSPAAQRRQAQRRGANNPEMMRDEDLPPPAKRGLNENYARELMELHTLGVDGGYTQKDIVEVAKVFTGWTARQPRLGGDYEFNWRLHEPGSKTVLGQKISEGGESEGHKVLHLLATHPSTARFISRKLAMRFVSDDPPPALVERMAATFAQSNGDIKAVLRTLFKSPEFWAQDAYRAKVKTPLEFVASAVRVTGAEVRNAQPLLQTLTRLGMPLYGAQPPTGYSMKADAWVNSAALLNRLNFALSLANGQVRGLVLSKEKVFGQATPANELEALTRALVAGDISRQTLETIRKQAADPKYQPAAMSDDMPRPGMLRMQGESLGVMAGLMLGSPEFQRR